MPTVVARCNECHHYERECLKCERFRLDREVELAHANGADCGREDCQECCPHDERDHGICLDCAHEADPGEAIDQAMDAWEAAND